MNVTELFARFPNIAPAFRTEPTVAELVEVWGDLLAGCGEPSNCATGYTAGHHYYLKIVAPMIHVSMGLANKDRVIEKLRAFIDGRRKDPQGFPLTLLPADVADVERKRCESPNQHVH